MPGLGTIKLVQQCIGTGLKQQAGGVDLAHGSDHSLLSPEVDSSGSAAGHTSRLKEKVSKRDRNSSTVKYRALVVYIAFCSTRS